jgi:hypothetical protein
MCEHYRQRLNGEILEWLALRCGNVPFEKLRRLLVIGDLTANVQLIERLAV